MMLLPPSEDELKANWISFQELKPKAVDFEVLSFSEKFIHPDFNPTGIRVGFMGEDNFISANWNNCGDAYENSYEEPTHWKHYSQLKTNQLKLEL